MHRSLIKKFRSRSWERLLFSFVVDGYGRANGVINDLRSQTLTLLRAFAVRYCAISLSLNKEMAKENQPKAAMFALVRSTMFAFSEQANLHFRFAESGRLWKLLPCRSSKKIEKKNINVFSSSLAAQPPRAADIESKICQNNSNIVERMGERAPPLAVSIV